MTILDILIDTENNDQSVEIAKRISLAEGEELQSFIRRMIHAVRTTLTIGREMHPCLRGIFDGYIVVVTMSDELFRVPFTRKGEEIAFGQATRVTQTFVPKDTAKE